MINKYTLNLKNNTLLYFIFIFGQLMSIRYFLNSSTFNQDIIYYYLYLICSYFIFVFFIHNYSKLKFLLEDNLLYFFLILLLILSLTGYNKIETSNIEGLGSDQDNCYLDFVENFYQSGKLAFKKSYLNNPCSTGYLTFLFYFPVFFGQFFIIIIIFFFLLIFKKILKIICKNKEIENTIFYFFSLNFVVIELLISGSDFIPIAISLPAGIIFFIEAYKKKRILYFILSFLFLSFFFGSRINLIVFYFPITLLFILRYKNKFTFVFFFLIGAFVSLSYTIPIIVLDQEIFFAHLVSKTFYFLKGSLTFWLILFLSGLATFAFFKKKKFIDLNNDIFFYQLVALIIFIPFLYGSLAFLHVNGYNIKTWEGLNYIIIAIPITLIALSNFLSKNRLFSNV